MLPPRSKLGYADLVRSLYTGAPVTEEQQTAIASLLGFERTQETKTPSDEKTQTQPVSEANHQPAEPPKPAPQNPITNSTNASYYRIIHHEKRQPEQDKPTFPDWFEKAPDLLKENKHNIPDCHRSGAVYPPLVAWSRLWPVLLKALGAQRPGRKPDVDKLVNWQASGKHIKRVPKKSRFTWTAQAWLLVDNNADISPLRQDYHALQHQLQHWRGVEGLDIQFVYQAVPGHIIARYQQGQVHYSDWQMPETDIPLVILSDLGLHSNNNRSLLAWLAFGVQLKQHGIRPTVLLPIAEKQLDPRLLNYYTCILWDRHSQLRPIVQQTITDFEPDVMPQLLALCYPAIRLNPGLIRSIRYCLPVACDVSYELSIRQQADIITSSLDCYWQPDSKTSYRTAFLNHYQQLSKSQQHYLIEQIACHHAHYPAELYFEVINTLAQLEIDLPAIVIQASEDHLSSLVKTLANTDQHLGLNAWAASRCQRLPIGEETVVLSQQQQALRIFSQLRNHKDNDQAIDWPEDIPADLIQLFLQTDTAFHQPLLVCQSGHQLQLINAANVQANDWAQPFILLTIPCTDKNVIYRYHDGKTQQKTLDISKPVAAYLSWPPGEHTLEINNELLTFQALDPANLPNWMLAYSMEAGVISMQTQNNSGQLFTWYWHSPWAVDYQKTFPGFWFHQPALNLSKQPPTSKAKGLLAGLFKARQTQNWLDHLARDEFGLYTDVNLAGVVQRFRWIPPGQFAMGSPEDEQGRYDNEVLHKVTISQGYWLADTTCTQALWQAVMGKNPSYFKGANLPVEQVSWLDVQTFLQKLNQLQPGLFMRLPSEAEWEYACRAGTQTAFNFDQALATDLVNYRGTWEWASEQWGEKALQATTAVKSYAANAWGLYEMHGNVWEWCQDWYGDYPAESATDPAGAIDGTLRVLRGGSWYNEGRICRSAFRSLDSPHNASLSIGFRLARGQ